MEPTFFDLEMSLGYMTITTNRLLRTLMRRSMQDAGLDVTAEQWGVLVHVWNRGQISQEELVASACVDKSSMSRILEMMRRKGLVSSSVDTRDRRRRMWRSTPKADAMQGRCAEVALGTLARAWAGIDDAEIAMCLSILARVKRTLGRALNDNDDRPSPSGEASGGNPT
ncbi:MAG: MarR family winged helix-turn-helix transcriptional regulator [Desulfovibrio sp.]|jgi:DNA-binding MarR family transcriptional regulator|nr:MarR family winged helix-turn-helix transcriptional regulator [Desulfovibrio sp.]